MKSETCFSKKNGEPLSQYYTQLEADEAATFIKENYQSSLIPYECSKCEYWHLTPKSRHTPSIECHSCFDRNGQRKQAYLTEKGALQRAQILNLQSTQHLRVYECMFGNGWHLTKT